MACWPRFSTPFRSSNKVSLGINLLGKKVNHKLIMMLLPRWSWKIELFPQLVSGHSILGKAHVVGLLEHQKSEISQDIIRLNRIVHDNFFVKLKSLHKILARSDPSTKPQEVIMSECPLRFRKCYLPRICSAWKGNKMREHTDYLMWEAQRAIEIKQTKFLESAREGLSSGRDHLSRFLPWWLCLNLIINALAYCQ